ESAVSQEAVAWLDDAELVALGVCEDNMRVLGALTDVDVPPAKPERPRDRLPLVLEGGARQIEVHLVRGDLLTLSWQESNPEAGVIARQKRSALLRGGDLPAQDASPEVRQTERIIRIEAEREEVTRHGDPHQPIRRRAAADRQGLRPAKQQR